MAHPSQPGTLVLHGLRVKGFAETDVLAEAAGLDDVVVVRLLERFAGEGLVKRRDDPMKAGWTLTPQGRAEDEKRLADELEASGARPAVEGAYEGFAALNPDLLRLCTDWQLKPDGAGELNDHTDAAYDGAVVGRLVDLHGRAQPVLARLAEALERFARYPVRLQRAVEKVTAGDHDWIDRATTDSYHTVWFELHEDLLATLGLERG